MFASAGFDAVSGSGSVAGKGIEGSRLSPKMPTGGVYTSCFTPGRVCKQPFTPVAQSLRN